MSTTLHSSSAMFLYKPSTFYYGTLHGTTFIIRVFSVTLPMMLWVFSVLRLFLAFSHVWAVSIKAHPIAGHCPSNGVYHTDTCENVLDQNASGHCW